MTSPPLEGVPATQSSVCDIDGQNGLLTYRGYRVDELAASSTFLETAYLLIWGELPDADQLAEFEHAVQMHRRVSFRIRDMMKCFPATGHPMDALQASARAGAVLQTVREPIVLLNAEQRIVLHNAAGLALGWRPCFLCRPTVSTPDVLIVGAGGAKTAV